MTKTFKKAFQLLAPFTVKGSNISFKKKISRKIVEEELMLHFKKDFFDTFIELHGLDFSDTEVNPVGFMESEEFTRELDFFFNHASKFLTDDLLFEARHFAQEYCEDELDAIVQNIGNEAQEDGLTRSIYEIFNDKFNFNDFSFSTEGYNPVVIKEFYFQENDLHKRLMEVIFYVANRIIQEAIDELVPVYGKYKDRLEKVLSKLERL